MDKNEDYPRIGRIKYLAEHKLSTDKISPKKIIDWYGSSEPLSGFGRMILGESYTLTGNKEKGIQLIKKGWITAELTKSELRFYRTTKRGRKSLEDLGKPELESQIDWKSSDKYAYDGTRLHR